MSRANHTNRLIQESSPYLLQHAHNPVDWFPWCDEAFEKAKKENKLVLVSIGYSACHWCHVMEHESFENDLVAKIMNEKFICIKVDREERPDVDGVYMSAVQIMTGSGGWPLNCFTLPDGRPVYGGTYFPKEKWIQVLQTLADYFKNEPEKVFQYSEELTNAVKKTELIPSFSDKPKFTEAILKECVDNWTKRFDNVEGGPNRSPKFPLPNNYQFLLRHYYFTKEAGLLRHINLTLEKMAFGGIYDQIGGGFARYSTDGEWKVPHFEKMLYDNSQLVSLYSEAYQFSKNNLYKQIVYETLEFIEREMIPIAIGTQEGSFYSALDADSEGVEGKYYVWTVDELKNILENDIDLFATYFNVNELGYWEHENYILLRKKSDEEIAKRYSITIEELQAKISELKKKVLAVREKRIKPGLDNKILTSWNALMIKGYADAYSVFHEKKILDAALNGANYILNNLSRADGGLFHTAPSQPSPKGKENAQSSPPSRETREGAVNGFLEDYSFTIEAFISLYQITFDEQWLNKAKSFADYALKHFHDSNSVMFYFTSDLDSQLIARKMEIQDNVIPSSNSSMAKSLFYLGKYFDDKNYLDISEKMLKQVQQDVIPYGSAYSNWAMLAQHFVYPFYEIAIVGNSVDEKRKQMSEHFIPNAIFVGSASPTTNLPLLENKFVEGKTLIYICVNKTCQLPTENINEALKQMEH